MQDIVLAAFFEIYHKLHGDIGFSRPLRVRS